MNSRTAGSGLPRRVGRRQLKVMERLGVAVKKTSSARAETARDGKWPEGLREDEEAVAEEAGKEDRLPWPCSPTIATVLCVRRNNRIMA